MDDKAFFKITRIARRDSFSLSEDRYSDSLSPQRSHLSPTSIPQDASSLLLEVGLSHLLSRSESPSSRQNTEPGPSQ